MEDFFKSRKGIEFLDHRLPKIASQLERIANALEKKNQIEEKKLILEQKRFIKNSQDNARITGSSQDFDESE